MGGNLIMPMATEPGMLMPIDSEHGAIYQCLLGEDSREVSKLWVTASGGPFRGKKRCRSGEHYPCSGFGSSHVEYGQENLYRLIYPYEQGS